MFIIWPLLLLGVLVLVHELGHFTIAKLTGVKVLAFSIGFGPRLLKYQFGETEYRICAIPLGGYVKMLAQESSEPIPPGILAVNPNGPAYSAGLRQGDYVTGILHKEVEHWSEIQDEIMLSDSSEIPFNIERKGEKLDITVKVDEPLNPQELPLDKNGRGTGITLPDMKMNIGDHPEELEKAFFTKPLWARFAVVFAGPLASLVFPILIYLIFFLSVSELTSSRIGQVLDDTPAAKAGLLPGDRIVAIDGKETPYWSSMASIIRDAGGKEITLTVKRGEDTFKTKIVPDMGETRNQIGDTVRTGRIGIASTTIPAVVSAVGENSPAYKAGIRNGDIITAINGEKIDFIWQLENQLKEVQISGRAISLDVTRKTDGQENTFKATLFPEENAAGKFWLGLVSTDTVIGKIEEDLPAYKAGLRSGDHIVSVNGQSVSAWMIVEQVLRESMEKPIDFVVERNGELLNLQVKQTKEVVKGEMQEEITRYRFGAWSSLDESFWLDGEKVPVNNGIGYAVSSSFATLVDITLMELNVFGKLLTGQLSMKMVGGPIMIFDVANKAAERGWEQYLWIMALISINLGILNLLPVPVLDGGHLMFFTVEAIMRRPINQQLKEKLIMVGFFMLMALMVLVFKNDIERYWDVMFG